MPCPVRRSPVWTLLFVAVAALASCQSASSEVSSTMRLRVDGAQLVPGLPSGPQVAAPRVLGLSLLSIRVEPGQRDKPISGALEAAARATVIYLDGDRAHYIVPAGPADLAAPGQPTFAARLSFAAWLSLGPQTLWVHAVDEAGQLGPGQRQDLQVVADLSQPGVEPALAITLSWNRPADLDLHVVEPDGKVVWSRRKGGAATGGSHGVLDWDSNAGCLPDGWNREEVSYALPPPPGVYRVLVDTPSLCGQSTAYFSVRVTARGEAAPLSEAHGQSLPSDTRGEHGAEAGTLALELRLP